MTGIHSCDPLKMGGVISSLQKLCEEQRGEIESLRKFADHILEGYSWGHDVDGGDAQEKAVELGIVELRPIDLKDSIDGETEHYFTKWTPKQALNQERLGDWKNKEVATANDNHTKRIRND